MSNPYGDIELGPKSMRALAHPVRLAILSRLQGHGPSTATALAPLVGATPSVTSWHLRHLAEHGLVQDADVEADGRQRWWEAAGNGFRFTPTDNESQDAASLLTRVLIDEAERLPAEWARDSEPLLEPQWRRSAGMSNTTVFVSADELDDIEAAIEGVLAPYVLRKADPSATPPPGARRVRMLRYVLPTAPVDEAGAEDQS